MYFIYLYYVINCGFVTFKPRYLSEYVVFKVDLCFGDVFTLLYFIHSQRMISFANTTLKDHNKYPDEVSDMEFIKYMIYFMKTSIIESL